MQKWWLALCVFVRLLGTEVLPATAVTNVMLNVLKADVIGKGLSLNLQQWTSLASSVFSTYGCGFSKMVSTLFDLTCLSECFTLYTEHS